MSFVWIGCGQRLSASLTLLACGLALVGCADPKPFHYDSANEIPSGPGLFSGQDGEFNLYRLDDDPLPDVIK